MKKDNIHISGIVSIYHDINKYIKKNSNSCGVCDFYCYQKSHRLPAILPLSTEETLVLGTGPGGLAGYTEETLIFCVGLSQYLTGLESG